MGLWSKIGCLILLGVNTLVLGVVVLAAAGQLHLLLELLLPPDLREMERVTSPDGANDAVLIVVLSGGATVGPHYELYVVRVGEEATDLWSSQRASARLFTTEHLQEEGYEVRWQDERVLEFHHYRLGEVWRFHCSSYPPQAGNDCPREIIYDEDT